MLCAQLSDWEKFRGYQATCRQRFQQGLFSEDAIRRRRRKYGVQGDILLQPDPKQQNRLQNWVEFQDYHFWVHETIEEESLILEKNWRPSPNTHALITQA